MSYPLSQSMGRASNIRILSNMGLFLSGKLVSLLGTSIYSFAIGLYVLRLTGSATNFALTIIFGMLPQIILGPIAGSIADRSNRKTMVVGMDLASGGLMILVYFLALNNGLELSYIYASAFLLTVFNTFFSVAFDASIPNIVDDKRLMKINSLNQSISSLTGIMGPVLGGLIYGLLDIKYFLLFNGISFIVSAISESFIDFNLNKPEIEDKAANRSKSSKDTNKKSNVLKDTIEGFKYIKQKSVLYTLMKFSLTLNFVFSGIFVALPYIVVNDIGLSSEQVGTVQGSLSLGVLVFSIVLSMLPEMKNKFRTLSLGVFGMGILLLALALSATGLLEMSKTYYLIYFVIINFAFGSISILINLPLQVSLQRETPDEYRGRIFGAIGSMARSIMPLGIAINGLLLDLIPSFLIPLVAGIIHLVLVILMGRNKALRKL